MEWVDSIKSVEGGRINVEKHDLGIRLGSVSDGGKPRFVWHTTEGFTLPNYVSGAPTIDVGPREKGGRQITRQLFPFGALATALQNDPGGIETNSQCIIQIEQVAFTAREIWTPSNEACEILASWALFAKEEFGVPLEYSYDPRDMASGTWATETNPWRQSKKFERQAGHHPHAAVDESDHWDCGGEDIPEILGIAKHGAKVEAHQLMEIWVGNNGHRHSRPVGASKDPAKDRPCPHFAKLHDLEKWMAKDDDNVRSSFFEALKAGHKIKIATRRVQEDKVRA